MKTQIAMTIAIFLALQSPAYASENEPSKSLFFSQQETEEARKQAHKQLPYNNGDIDIGAIIYYSEKDWVIWIQGKKWTPNTTSNDLKITRVTPASVSLIYKKDGKENAITLAPHQSYRTSTGKFSRSY